MSKSTDHNPPESPPTANHTGMTLPHCAGLISDKAIPSQTGGSSGKEKLVIELQAAVSECIGDPNEFTTTTVQALVMGGDCTGLASTRGGHGRLMSELVKREILLASREQNAHSDTVRCALQAVDRMDSALSGLVDNGGWDELAQPPDPLGERLVHFQYRILSAPAYPVVAARLHGGLCAKARQLHGRGRVDLSRGLEGLANPLARIVLRLPAQHKGRPLEECAGTELDEVVHDAIWALQRQGIGPGGRNQYAESTLRKYSRVWLEAFYAIADTKAYRGRGRGLMAGRIRRASHGGIPEELSTSDPLRQVYLAECDRSDADEAAELKVGAQVRRKPSARQAGQGISDPAIAAVALVLPKTMSGVLPLSVLAVVWQTLRGLDDGWDSLNFLGAQALVSMMLHLGTTPEWLLSMRVGPRPASVWECSHPVYVASEGTVFFQPRLYLGLPLPPHPGFAPNESARWRQQLELHEQISPMRAIVLPSPVRAVCKRYIQERESASSSNGDAGRGADRVQAGDGFWLRRAGQDVRPMELADVRAILHELSIAVQSQVPGFPELRPTRSPASL